MTELVFDTTGAERQGQGRESRVAGVVWWLMPPAVTLGLVVLAWWGVVALFRPPVYLLPGPGVVLARLVADPWFFASNTLLTAGEAAAGLAIGGGVAFAVGVPMALWRPLERAVLPLAILIKVTPIVAVAPLFLIWFGFGAWPKVLVAALITFFPTLIATVQGLRSVDSALQDVFDSVAASAGRQFVELRLPSAAPLLVAALKVSVPLSLIGAVVGEWVGAEAGMGHHLMRAYALLDMPTLVAGVLCLAVTGVLATAAVSLLERRVVHWQ